MKISFHSLNVGYFGNEEESKSPSLLSYEVTFDCASSSSTNKLSKHLIVPSKSTKNLDSNVSCSFDYYYHFNQYDLNTYKKITNIHIYMCGNIFKASSE